MRQRASAGWRSRPAQRLMPAFPTFPTFAAHATAPAGEEYEPDARAFEEAATLLGASTQGGRAGDGPGVARSRRCPCRACSHHAPITRLKPIAPCTLYLLRPSSPPGEENSVAAVDEDTASGIVEVLR